MNEDLKLTLSQLASLSYHKNSKVALAARQVGCGLQLPWKRHTVTPFSLDADISASTVIRAPLQSSMMSSSNVMM